MRRRIPRAVAAIAAAALVVVALAACGSSSGGPSATSSSPGAATANVKKIDVTLTGSKVEPPPDTVKVAKGTTVELTVTRDSDGEIHIHGYDIAKTAKAGVPVTFRFVADQPGIFEIEAHSPDVLLLQLQVQ